MTHARFISKFMLPALLWASVAATPVATWAQVNTSSNVTRTAVESKRSAAEASLLRADSVRIELENKDIMDCYGTDRVALAHQQLVAAHQTFIQADVALAAGTFGTALQLFQSVQVSSENSRALLGNSQRQGNFSALATKRCSYATRPDMRYKLMIGAQTDKQVYRVGEVPMLTITATNLTNTALPLDFINLCRVGYTLDWGQLIPDSNCFTQGTSPVVISPHGSYSWTLYYDKGSGLGNHDLTAWIRGYGNATVAIRVIP